MVGHPQNKLRLTGESAKLCCTVDGNPPPEYFEWYDIFYYRPLCNIFYLGLFHILQLLYFIGMFIFNVICPCTTGLKALFNQSNCTSTTQALKFTAIPLTECRGYRMTIYQHP